MYELQHVVPPEPECSASTTWLGVKPLARGFAPYPVHMLARVRRLVGRLILAALRMRLIDENPGARRPLVIAAPHTSYADAVMLVGMVWSTGYNVRAMVEKRFFVGPFDRFFRSIGGIPIDRKNPTGVIEEFTALLGDPSVMLVIAPEGTRSKREYWKSGFYRIARGAGVSVTLGYIDMRSRVCGLGPSIELTGDVAADMEVIRAFYAGKTGWKRGQETPPRLSSEPRDDRELNPAQRR